MGFRIESAGLEVGGDDRVIRSRGRVVCDACGIAVDGAKSIAHARTSHVCPKVAK